MNLTEILAHKYNLVVDYFNKTKECPSIYLDENCPLEKACINCLAHTVKPKFYLLYSNVFKHNLFKKYAINNNLEPNIKITRDNLEDAKTFSKGKVMAYYDEDSHSIKVMTLCGMNFRTKNAFHIIKDIDNNCHCYSPLDETYYIFS